MLAGAYLFPPLHDSRHLPAGDSKSHILLCKESTSRMISEEIYLYMIGLYFHKLNYLSYYFEFQSFLRAVMTHLQRRIIVPLWTWHDKQEKFVDKKTKKMHNRAYNIQNSHMEKSNELSIVRQGQPVSFSRSTSSFAVDGRSVVSQPGER